MLYNIIISNVSIIIHQFNIANRCKKNNKYMYLLFTIDIGSITVMKKKSFPSRILLSNFPIITDCGINSKKSNTVAIMKNPKCMI